MPYADRLMAKRRVIESVAFAAIVAASGCNGGIPQSSALQLLPHTQRAEPGSTFASLYSFAGGSDGSNPAAGLTALNGVLYGTTAQGGSAGEYGTVFSIKPPSQEKIVYRFGGPPGDGQRPSGELSLLNGALYGTTAMGGSGGCATSGAYGCGTVFAVTPGGQQKYLYSFQGGSIDGAYPDAGVTVRNAALFGTTQSGGAFGYGMVFAITVYGEEGTLYNFLGSLDGDGAVPKASLFEFQYGVFYATTQQGGTPKRKCGAFTGCGTVYSITVGGREGALYSFKGGKDAWGPIGNLVAIKNRLFGAAEFGGAYRNGAVFSVTPPPTVHEKVLYSFQGEADGAYPAAGLIDVNGTLYGTTSAGGGSANCSGGCGTIFSITRSGKEIVLHSFSGTDGASPVGRLIQVGSGLYGTTSAGGTSNLGTVFELSLK